MVLLYLEHKLYKQEGYFKDECFKREYKQCLVYYKHFRKIQRRFKYYRNKVLRKFIESKRPSNLIETSEMKELILT